jgi:hypothetical protein
LKGEKKKTQVVTAESPSKALGGKVSKNALNEFKKCLNALDTRCCLKLHLSSNVGWCRGPPPEVASEESTSGSVDGEGDPGLPSPSPTSAERLNASDDGSDYHPENEPETLFIIDDAKYETETKRAMQAAGMLKQYSKDNSGSECLNDFHKYLKLDVTIADHTDKTGQQYQPHSFHLVSQFCVYAAWSLLPP